MRITKDNMAELVEAAEWVAEALTTVAEAAGDWLEAEDREERRDAREYLESVLVDTAVALRDYTGVLDALRDHEER